MGHFSPAGSTSCTRCPPSTYAASRGQGQCIPCPYRVSSSNGIQCDVCGEGYYRVDPSIPPSTDSCRLCPRGASCGLDTTMATLNLSVGFWRLSNRTIDIQSCGAQGADARCRGGVTSIGDDSCAPGLSGPWCQVCPADTYFDEKDGLCQDCPELRAAPILGFLFALLITVAVGVALFRTRRRHPLIRRYRRAVRGVLSLKSSLQAKGKIALSFHQIALTLDSTYSVVLPPSYTDWTRSIKNAISLFDVSDLIGIKTACLGGGYESRMIAVAVGPLLLTALVMASVIVWKLISLIPGFLPAGLMSRGADRHRYRTAGAPSLAIRNAVVDGVVSGIPFMLLVSFFFVSGVSSDIFKAMACVGFGVDDIGQDASVPAAREERFFLCKQLSIECYTSEHDSLKRVMWVFAAIWPVGVVCFYALLLYPVRDSMFSGKKTTMTRSLSFCTPL